MREYHQRPGVSNSMLKIFADEPREYFDRFVAKVRPRWTDPTPAMQFGLDVEAACWGKPPTQNVVIMENVGFKMRGCKAHDEFVAAHPGMECLWPKEYEQRFEGIDEAVKSLKNHAVANALLFGPADPWPKCTWACPVTEIERKCEIDIIENGCIVDLKTSRVVAPDAFSRHAHNLRYHWQAATYQEAVYATTGEMLPVVFVVVKNVYPWTCMTYEMDGEWIANGLRTVHFTMQRLLKSLQSDDWNQPGHGELLSLQGPRWAGISDYQLEESEA